MPFADVVGHSHVIAELRRALERDALPHALLFTGRAGVGKRTTALALIAARACASPRAGDGCGICAACRAVARLDHQDLEILARERGKRDVGIQQIRDLLERLHLAASSKVGRAAVVDGAERLTPEAQNAFLKTLEEPPRGALLILVTHAPQRLLPTVRSRCQAFRFGPLSDPELLEFRTRRGLDLAGVPLGVGLGSPGAWMERAEPPLPAGRTVVLSLLSDRPPSPFDFAAQLLELSRTAVEDEPLAEGGAVEEAPVDDGSETARRRLATWITQLEWGLRDAFALAAGGVARCHTDHGAPLGALGRRADPDGLLAAASLCAGARGDLFRNVDRALLLETLALSLRRCLA
jgi:DNA polymerase-3 subunit delta'